jgi:hypothetical protein
MVQKTGKLSRAFASGLRHHQLPLRRVIRIGSKAWVAGNSETILNLLWDAYDQLRQNPNLKTALSNADEDIERGLTLMLCLALDNLRTGDEPFQIIPEAPEDESRKKAPARPRAYDIAFAMRANPRIMWSVEAKVMATPSTTADYVRTFNERFLTGNYAPFVGEGCMLGYLQSGTHDEAFKAITLALKARLIKSSKWKSRAHRCSSHGRKVPKGKHYPVKFRCHHLIMQFA